MHIPTHFRNDHSEEVFEFIKANGFAALVTGGIRPIATHIPLVLSVKPDGIKVLQGHISIGNPQWKLFVDQPEVLAIFTGPHAYISSSWYDHDNVPTWNYEAVHVYGTISLLEGDGVIQSLKELVDKYEAASACPVAVERMDSKMLAANVKGIVAFEIVVTEIQAAFKLSQNRSDVDHENIIKELEIRNMLGDQEVANSMRRARSGKEE